MQASLCVQTIQNELFEEGICGWLLYDFKRSNPLACQLLCLKAETMLTRRFFYWIPARGDPVKFVHRVEGGVLSHLPGEEIAYGSRLELESGLKRVLKGKKKIAMEYSPCGEIPYLSCVDGGTMEWIAGFDCEIVPSQNLIQRHTCVMSQEQMESHRYAAKVLDEAVEGAFHLIARSREIDEYTVQQWILERFLENGCVSSDAPIVAVGGHTADPHYQPKREGSAPIKDGDFVLIDLWCKQNRDDAIYADICRVGVVADKPTEKQQKIFSIVREAQKKGFELVQDRVLRGKTVRGFEVDRICRKIINDAGYGELFVHRTGHNIWTEDHGPGAHLDDFETRDSRLLIAGTCFSIEPGIYLPGQFGVRLEHDVLLDLNGGIEITGGVQEGIVVIKNLMT